MRTVLRIFAALGAVLFAVPADAQTYPSKPITVVVPFGPGSGTDLITRIIAQRLSAAVGQSVIVENKAGANGTLAANFVARAEPDGYTLFMSTNTPHSAAPFLMKSISYDPAKDFVALSRVGASRNCCSSIPAFRPSRCRS